MINFNKIKILLLFLIVGLCISISDTSVVLLSQTNNKKVTTPKPPPPKPKPQNKPKFPDRYSTLDNPKAVKTITEEMVETKIENAHQSYIKGLILLDKQDTTDAIPYIEAALVELNKLASYPEIENNENYIELLNNVLADYNAITKNKDDINLIISPKQRIFEEESIITDSVIVADPIEDSVYIKPPSADTSDKYIFDIPHITELQIPMTENQAVEEQIALLTIGRLKTYPPRWMQRSSKWFPLMKTIAEKEGMPNEILVLTFIESGLNPLAESSAGAVGLWQFMYPTGIDYNLNKKQSIWVDERRDPVKSTRAAMRYLRDLYLEFSDWYLALNAYNWGWGKVRKALRQCNADNPTYWDIRNQKNISMPKEARAYVPLFLAVLRITSEPEKYGIDVNTLNYEPEFKFDILEIEQATNLSAIAQCIGVGVTEIKELNPELLYDITPPDKKYYSLRIPVGTGKNFASNFAKLPDDIKQPSLEHRVLKNETIISVAEKFDVSIDDLIKINLLNAKYITLEPNKVIKIPIGGKTFAQSGLVLSNNQLVQKSSLFVSDNNYYVAENDISIYEIAEKYKISPANIRNWNNIAIDQDTIEAGKVIVVSGFEAEKNRLRTIENKNAESPTITKTQAQTISTNQDNVVSTSNNKNIQNNTSTHKVVSGDNLYNIAQRYGTTENAIKALNPKLKDDKIIIGNVLIVPNNTLEDTSNNSAKQNVTTNPNEVATTSNNKNKQDSPVTHTVVQGDNLYRIAVKYGTTTNNLKSLNKDINPDKLSLGQKIRIK